MAYSFKAELKQLPGRARLALLFALVIPTAAIYYVTIIVEHRRDFDLFPMWLVWIGVSALLGYAVVAVVGLLVWVQDGFTAATQIKMLRLLSGVARILVIIAAGLFIATVLRYYLAEPVDKSEKNYSHVAL